MTETERLAKIAELLPSPCPEPGMANGMDLCPCGYGGTWPCRTTRAAWLAAGLDPDEQVRVIAASAVGIWDLGW